jgi:GxxExxY protein
MNTDKKQTRKSGGGEHKGEMDQRMEELTERVLGAVFEVANELGVGFLEKVYERALVRELGARGVRAAAQAPMEVNYKGYGVGEYFADVLVEGVLVVELKCVERLGNEHMAQCLNYLKASGLNVCLLINFQRSKVEWRRILRKQEEWPRMNTDEHG